MLNIGRVRYGGLQASGRVLKILNQHNGYTVARMLFKFYTWLWELVSPSKVFRVLSSTEYGENHRVKSYLIKQNRKGYAANVVAVGENDAQELREVELPELALYSLRDVSICNGSDLIINSSERIVVSDFIANKHDENQAYHDSITYLEDDRVAILKKRSVSKSFQAGIRIGGKYSFNYYHNVYENLIALLAVEKCNEKIPADVPLIVDSKIFQVPSYKRIFEILSSNLHRDVVVLDKDEMAHVEHLFVLSSINFLVPEHKKYNSGGIEDYVFDKDYVMQMRERLLSYKSNKDFPKRFFITRKSMSHRQINEKELYEVLKPLGFVMIAPEEYSFEEQMALFHGAEWIVGCSGAAFTNLMFCSVGCTIICLDRFGYKQPVFSAPACFAGARMLTFYSDPAKSEQKAHSDFAINEKDFAKFINTEIRHI